MIAMYEFKIGRWDSKTFSGNIKGLTDKVASVPKNALTKLYARTSSGQAPITTRIASTPIESLKALRR